jgi:hypothetical protein
MKTIISLFTCVIALLLISLSAVAAPVIEVSPTVYDFGDVEVGTTMELVVTIQNVGPDAAEISIALSGSSDFSCDCPGEVVGLPALSSLFVTVTFTPSTAGYVTAVLDVSGVVVSLGGMGVAQEPPPSVTVQDILAFFDESVADGTLYGNGPGNSANARKGALRNMIKAVGDLIEDGAIVQACQQLMDAYSRTDGLERPPEFVTGPAASILAGMILDLMASLGC